MDKSAKIEKGSHDQHTPVREPQQICSLGREGIILSKKEQPLFGEYCCCVRAIVIVAENLETGPWYKL